MNASIRLSWPVFLNEYLLDSCTEQDVFRRFRGTSCLQFQAVEIWFRCVLKHQKLRTNLSYTSWETKALSLCITK